MSLERISLPFKPVSVADYKSEVEKDVQALGLTQGVKQANWKDARLVPLAMHTSPEILEAAHKAESKLQAIFPELQLILRPAKTWERFNHKCIEAANARKPENKWPKNEFRVISDYMGARIACENDANMEERLVFAEKVVKDLKGLSYRRRLFDDGDVVESPYGEYRRVDGVARDIFQMFYFFIPVSSIPEFGFIGEFQLGDPIAFETFNYDNARRDAKNRGEKTDSMVNLWDHDFYPHVKAYKLAIANKLDKAEYDPGTGEIINITKDQLRDELNQCFKDRSLEVPQKISNMIERLPELSPKS